MIKINVHIDDAAPFDISVSHSDNHEQAQVKALANSKVIEALANRGFAIASIEAITGSRMKLTIETQAHAERIKAAVAAQDGPASITTVTAVEIIESLRKKIEVRDEAIEKIYVAVADFGERLQSILKHQLRYDKEIDSGKR